MKPNDVQAIHKLLQETAKKSEKPAIFAIIGDEECISALVEGNGEAIVKWLCYLMEHDENIAAIIRKAALAYSIEKVGETMKHAMEEVAKAEQSKDPRPNITEFFKKYF